MKAKIYILCFLVISFFKGISQAAFLPGINSSLINLNPSFAGSNGGVRDQAMYQSVGQGSQYSSSTYNNLDTYIKPLKAGISISYLHNRINSGQIASSGIGIAYAQHLNLFDKKLKVIPSFQALYMQETIDLNSLTFGSLLLNPAINITYWNSYPIIPQKYLTMNTGLLINYKNLYAGISVFNLNQPGLGIAQPMLRRFSANASYNFHLSEKTLFNISARYVKQSNYEMSQLMVTAVLYKYLIAGLGYAASGYSSDNAYHFYYGNYITQKFYRNTASASLGYRNNFMSVTGYYNFLFNRNGGSTRGYGASLSLNIRNKDQWLKLTNVEAW